MDLQTRKLNLISYLAQIQDEKFVELIEEFILQKQGRNSELKPFTIEELLQRVEESENDYKNGNLKTQEDLEQLSAKW